MNVRFVYVFARDFFVVEMGYYGGVNVADATGIGLIQCCYVEGTKYQVPGGTVCC